MKSLGDFQAPTAVFIGQSAEDWISVRVVGAEDDDSGQVPVEVLWPANVPGYEVGQRITARSDLPAWTDLSASTVAAQARALAEYFG